MDHDGCTDSKSRVFFFKQNQPIFIIYSFFFQAFPILFQIFFNFLKFSENCPNFRVFNRKDWVVNKTITKSQKTSTKWFHYDSQVVDQRRHKSLLLSIQTFFDICSFCLQTQSCNHNNNRCYYIIVNIKIKRKATIIAHEYNERF